MADIKRPPELSGPPAEQIGQIRQYLWELSEELNNRMNGIGSNELTDGERETIRPYFKNEMKEGRMISMKDMIIRTAGTAQSGIKEAKDQANAALAILKGFVDGTDCPANTNLNNLKEQGTYYFIRNNAQTATNSPTTEPFSLLVIRRRLADNSDSVNQIVKTITTTGLWFRYSSDDGAASSWSQWQTLI